MLFIPYHSTQKLKFRPSLNNTEIAFRNVRAMKTSIVLKFSIVLTNEFRRCEQDLLGVSEIHFLEVVFDVTPKIRYPFFYPWGRKHEIR